MSRRSSLYPRYAIGRLLLSELQRQGLSRAELARRMGYANPTKALTRFDNLVRGRSEPAYILERIVDALGLNPDIVAQATAETEETSRGEEEEAARMQEAQDRATFEPYVVVETSRSMPQPIHIGIMFYASLKHIDVPKAVTKRPIAEQIEWVAHRTARHFVERKGSAVAFGEITGYTYRRTYDRAITFDVQGRLTNHFADRPIEGRGTLYVKGKPLVRAGSR
jgi:transcriptional regulator with XRE-family HTH domain